MYQVTKTTNIAGQVTINWIREFNDENKAINCLMEHASYFSLEVREDKYYASSDGNKPETEIEIVQYS